MPTRGHGRALSNNKCNKVTVKYNLNKSTNHVPRGYAQTVSLNQRVHSQSQSLQCPRVFPCPGIYTFPNGGKPSVTWSAMPSGGHPHNLESPAMPFGGHPPHLGGSPTQALPFEERARAPSAITLLLLLFGGQFSAHPGIGIY